MGQTSGQGSDVELAVGRAAQALADHIARGDGGSEDFGGQGSDLLALFGFGSRPRQRGTGADALKVGRPHRAPQPAYQHGHVGSLPTPVGVEFVEHQEGQVRGPGDQCRAFQGPRQHQFEHHVVG